MDFELACYKLFSFLKLEHSSPSVQSTKIVFVRLILILGLFSSIGEQFKLLELRLHLNSILELNPKP